MHATSLALCSLTSMLPQHPDAPQDPHLAMARWQHQRLLDEHGHLPADGLHTARTWRQGVVATTGSLDDGGLNPTNWTSIGPDNYAGRTRALVFHPYSPQVLYVGTDVGVFASEDGGATWSANDEGPTDAPVTDLQWQPGTTTLHLATTGRGLWRAEVGTGTVVDLGPGCAGTAGTPRLTATVARFGRSSTITVTNLPPSAAGWMAQGTSATSWFGNPLPFSLAGFGAPGCWLRTSLDWLRDAGSSAAGSLSTTLPIANDPALVNTEFHLQYFVHDPSANGMGKVTSNTLRLRIGF